MVRPLPGHLALKDFNARKAVAGAPSHHFSRPSISSPPPPRSQRAAPSGVPLHRPERDDRPESSLGSHAQAQRVPEGCAYIFSRTLRQGRGPELTPERLACADPTDGGQEPVHGDGARWGSLFRVWALQGESTLRAGLHFWSWASSGGIAADRAPRSFRSIGSSSPRQLATSRESQKRPGEDWRGLGFVVVPVMCNRVT